MSAMLQCRTRSLQQHNIAIARTAADGAVEWLTLRASHRLNAISTLTDRERTGNGLYRYARVRICVIVLLQCSGSGAVQWRSSLAQRRSAAALH